MRKSLQFFYEIALTSVCRYVILPDIMLFILTGGIVIIMKNMIEERFELLSLIFRLTGKHWEYSEIRNDYQKEIVETFAECANHKTVEYVKEKELNGYNNAAQFPAHVEKKNGKFVFIESVVFPY